MDKLIKGKTPTEYHRDWNRAKQLDPEWRKRKLSYKRMKQQLRKAECVALKGNQCVDCNQSYPLECYDFHHRDASEKEFGPAQMFGTQSMATILIEIEKCDLICANCHRIRHKNERDYG